MITVGEFCVYDFAKVLVRLCTLNNFTFVFELPIVAGDVLGFPSV